MFSHLLPLLDVDPNSVRAGWLPLGLVVLLLVIIIGLYFSLRHEIKKIQVPHRADLESDDPKPANR